MRYLIILERGEHNFSAYAPDLPVCVASGDTREKVLTAMREALELHREGMTLDGEPIPAPNSDPVFVDVQLPMPA